MTNVVSLEARKQQLLNNKYEAGRCKEKADVMRMDADLIIAIITEHARDIDTTAGSDLVNSLLESANQNEKAAIEYSEGVHNEYS